MKTAFLFMSLFLNSLLFAQPKANDRAANRTANSIQPALNEVIQDYFNHFQNSKGVVESDISGIVSYESKIKLPGALSCTIVKYDSPDAYSWTAVMFEDEDFQTAVKKYNEYYREINNHNFQPFGFEKYLLAGKLDNAEESRSFASTLLRLNGTQKEMEHFFVDLGMQYEFPKWVVKISVYEKMPDDEMRPGMKTIQ
ncbi:MAG: hypothetical protein J0H55_02745 [Chitinophagaceae bacterium]|nr:hypothetical protein [Chitinophagaceae bacterium]